ncbi:MAG: hypothetical protein EXR78_01530 [Deltaproteobacteria bacterium]|nr:hypothetical protein [Deltaproteobacteria bacterium]
MDGRGNYTIYKYRRGSADEPYGEGNKTVEEKGLYKDGGEDEIILTNSDGRTYKIRVWNREDKDAQYRVLGQ